EFSLTSAPDTLDLPLRDAPARPERPDDRPGDLSILGPVARPERVRETANPAGEPQPVDATGAASASRYGELPLFGRPIPDDLPLITRPSPPRTPLGVRRATPDVHRVRPVLPRTPTLDLVDSSAAEGAPVGNAPDRNA